MKKNIDRIYVHPDFKKFLKRESVEKDMSVIQLTEALSKVKLDIHEELKKKRKFDFL